MGMEDEARGEGQAMRLDGRVTAACCGVSEWVVLVAPGLFRTVGRDLRQSEHVTENAVHCGLYAAVAVVLARKARKVLVSGASESRRPSKRTPSGASVVTESRPTESTANTRYLRRHRGNESSQR